jgi:hypothetical protein
MHQISGQAPRIEEYNNQIGSKIDFKTPYSPKTPYWVPKVASSAHPAVSGLQGAYRAYSQNCVI